MKMRMIDVDELWTDITSEIDDCSDVLDIIERQTVVDTSKELICSVNVSMDTDEVMERLKERGWESVKHGRWIENCVTPITATFIEAVRESKCNNCQKWHTMPYHYGAEDYEYCPHCGARMDL